MPSFAMRVYCAGCNGTLFDLFQIPRDPNVVAALSLAVIGKYGADREKSNRRECDEPQPAMRLTDDASGPDLRWYCGGQMGSTVVIPDYVERLIAHLEYLFAHEYEAMPGAFEPADTPMAFPSEDVYPQDVPGAPNEYPEPGLALRQPVEEEGDVKIEGKAFFARNMNPNVKH